MATCVVRHESLLPVPAQVVWDRVTTADGINAELRPWMTMSVPAGADDLDLGSVEPVVHLGKSWIRLFGVVPVDYDDISIVELEPGRRFLERSRMFSSPVWQHERIVDPVDDHACRVSDVVTFTPRAALRPLAPRVLAALFAHRHRRLRRQWPD
ncbi:hypothetical protein [Aeromicrobium alkaliterrae]|uniref:SRPBCC family protein n=1 Tax=Aeromicrobium alkaliterrae TaxID=302168 RepID=A0ABN2JRB6_9ACTN